MNNWDGAHNEKRFKLLIAKYESITSNKGKIQLQIARKRFFVTYTFNKKRFTAYQILLFSKNQANI